MSRNPALALRLCFAAAFVAMPPLLRASEAAAPEKDYHDVKVQTGDKSTVIRVKNSVGPRLHGQLPSDGHYDPQNMDLGRTSSFANKEFSTRDSALSKSDTALEGRTNNRFATKSFSGLKSDSTSGFEKTYKTTPFADSSRENSDAQKSFATSPSDITQGKDSSFAAKTSSFQGQKAELGGPKTPPYAGFSNLNDKTFFDPEMTHVRRDPYAAASNLDVARMVDLPNRPLTIDEVRNLINHETVPSLNVKPDAPTKPLNDPDYEPPTVAPFSRAEAGPAPEEKDNGLPSPGMMATPPAPGDSEPLPK